MSAIEEIGDVGDYDAPEPRIGEGFLDVIRQQLLMAAAVPEEMLRAYNTL